MAPGPCFIQVGDNCPATELQLRCCRCSRGAETNKGEDLLDEDSQLGLEDEQASDGQKGTERIQAEKERCEQGPQEVG